MILKALQTIILKRPSGNITVHKGDVFRTESFKAIQAGYARKLNRIETLDVLNQYVTAAKNIFRVKD
jgi:hypothetical protein